MSVELVKLDGGCDGGGEKISTLQIDTDSANIDAIISEADKCKLFLSRKISIEHFSSSFSMKL